MKTRCNQIIRIGNPRTKWRFEWQNHRKIMEKGQMRTLRCWVIFTDISLGDWIMGYINVGQYDPAPWIHMDPMGMEV